MHNEFKTGQPSGCERPSLVINVHFFLGDGSSKNFTTDSILKIQPSLIQNSTFIRFDIGKKLFHLVNDRY